MRMATCHPERKHAAKGLCRPCYLDYWAKHTVHRAATCHPERPVVGYGLCQSCYHVARTKGTLPLRPEKRLEVIIREHCDRTVSCWLWRRALSTGVPTMLWHGRQQGVRRLLWEAEHGPIPKGMFASTSCGIERCVRREHIRLKTKRELVARASAQRKGHRPPGFGPSKLPPEASQEMLDLWAQGWTQTAIGEKFGVCQHSVYVRLRELGKPPAVRNGTWIDRTRLRVGAKGSKARRKLSDADIAAVMALKEG
jgi:hypothetical protein